MDPDFVNKHFIPVALDTYYRGNSQEVAFCKDAGVGGNHLKAVTAGGRPLEGGKGKLLMRQRELKEVVEEYRALPYVERRPQLPDPKEAKPAGRPVPEPPPGGLVLMAYCTYVDVQDGKVVRDKVYFWPKNRNRWETETQSDTLWLLEEEKKSLLPADPTVGQTFEVAQPIQKRFFSTVAIDFMEGSVESLLPSEMALTLTVDRVTDGEVAMRLEGHGAMGKPFDKETLRQRSSRGCEIRVSGRLTADRATGEFTRVDVVGVGRAWGSNGGYRNHAGRPTKQPWMYGIALELVKGEEAIGLLPPYNMIHYNSASTRPYFPREETTASKEKERAGGR